MGKMGNLSAFSLLIMSILSVSMGDNATTTTPSSTSSTTTVAESTANFTASTTQKSVNSTEQPVSTTTESSKNVTDVPAQPLSFIFQECYDNCPDERPMIFDYYHGEGIERCGISNGLLCIANDQLQKTKPNWKGKYFSEYSNYRWQKNDKVEKNFSHEHYEKGVEVIMFSNKSENFHSIEIPTSFTESSSCSLGEDLKFAEPKTIKCLRLVKEACTYAKNFLLQFFDSKVLQSPKLASGDVKLINTTFEHCQSFHENCSKISGNFSEISSILDLSCIDNITVKFITNSSNILNVSIIASSSGEKSVTCDPEDSSLKIIQTIEIVFEEINSTVTKFIKRKPRGYEDGDILLITHRRPVNDSDPQSEKVFDLFRYGSMITEDDLKLKIPQSKNAKCDLTDEIHFNENSLIRCKIELDSQPKVNQSICQHYQIQIMDFLFHSINLTANYTRENFVSNIFVSKSWLPVRDFVTWTRVDIKGLPPWEPEERFDAKNTSIACVSLPNKVSYSILSSKMFSVDAKKYEHLVERITVEIESNGEIELKAEDKESDAERNLRIEVRIQFDDVELQSGAQLSTTATKIMTFSMVFILYLKYNSKCDFEK